MKHNAYRFRIMMALLALLTGPWALSGKSPSELQPRIDGLEPGETLTLEPGVWQGPVVINQPCTLRSEGAAVIHGDGKGHVIHVLAREVHLQGLTVSGSGLKLSEDHAGIMIEGSYCQVTDSIIRDSLHGIYLKEASQCRIQGNRILGKTEKLVPVSEVRGQGLKPVVPGLCSVRLNINQRGNGIHLWNSSGNVLKRNVIQGTRDGIYFSFAHQNKISSNHIHHVRYGLHYMYSDNNSFWDNHFNANAAGAALMYSEGLRVENNRFIDNTGHRAYGLLMQSVDNTTIRSNLVQNNTVGLYLENSNLNRFELNDLTGSYIGIRLTQSSRENAFTLNRFQRNLHSVEMSTTQQYNRWAVDGSGNHWEMAVPVDLNGDGVGELPHRETDLLGRTRSDFPLAALLSRSPFLDLMAFVQSRAELPGVPSIRDPAPLARPPRRQTP